MKPLPADPMAQHARLMSALCADFATPEFLRTGKTPRADAVVSVARHTRETK